MDSTQNNISLREIGEKAETKACEYLLSRGWEILGRNLYFQKSDIDILGRDGDTLVVIEVKYRSHIGHGFPQEFFTQQKIYHLKKSLAWIQSKYQWDEEKTRIDGISILKNGQNRALLTHYKNLLVH